MCTLQLRKGLYLGLVDFILVFFVKSTAAQVTFTFGHNPCHYAGDQLVLMAQYAGTSIVDSVEWYFEKQIASNILITVSGCTVFGVPDTGYPSSRMTFSCDTASNNYTATISNLISDDNGEWGVKFTFNDFSFTTLEKKTFTLCTPCNVTSVANGQTNGTGAVKADEVIVVICNERYVIGGSSTLTCQQDGTWDPQAWPTCSRPRPCRLHICYIGVYVAAFSAVVFLVVYFIVRCPFDNLCGADFLLKIVLSSCGCMVICIIIGVAICIPKEPDCDAGVGIGVPIVIVIILHPCVTAGVIACHIKCCPSLGESSESCLGRNRSILPICSGQDPQNPQNPGQPPQRQAEPQIRHGPGGTQSNQGRPQPQSGDEKHHSSVQKSNPEKSGSAVSGSHVAFDEEPFKPRKLPGIPADSKNARGLSANFDEVLPDKHRLTPLGQEARFDEFEETPKKKKKKKKSSEKDLDTSTDL